MLEGKYIIHYYMYAFISMCDKLSLYLAFMYLSLNLEIRENRLT